MKCFVRTTRKPTFYLFSVRCFLKQLSQNSEFVLINNGIVQRAEELINKCGIAVVDVELFNKTVQHFVFEVKKWASTSEHARDTEQISTFCSVRLRRLGEILLVIVIDKHQSRIFVATSAVLFSFWTGYILLYDSNDHRRASLSGGTARSRPPTTQQLATERDLSERTPPAPRHPRLFIFFTFYRRCFTL